MTTHLKSPWSDNPDSIRRLPSPLQIQEFKFRETQFKARVAPGCFIATGGTFLSLLDSLRSESGSVLSNSRKTQSHVQTVPMVGVRW